jgi:hypothetical protein
MQCSRIDSSILPLWWRQPITLHHQNPQLCAITFAREADWLNRHPSILLEELQGDWCWLLLSDHVVFSAGDSANKLAGHFEPDRRRQRTEMDGIRRDSLEQR